MIQNGRVRLFTVGNRSLTVAARSGRLGLPNSVDALRRGWPTC